MFTPDQYQLIDFGSGRRLEAFGSLVLDRPCPAVEKIPRSDPAAWQRVDARFLRTGSGEGRWVSDRKLPERWTISHGAVTLELKRTGFGHLGVFPEQAANWDWITREIEAAGRPLSVLNLFAYTGGSTLAAAAAGAKVVHVDAAENIITWARRNAELSGMAAAPVRWIAEDAVKFARRELKRGNRYDAVILDPPSYGHGPRGEVWRLSSQLSRLVELCGRLTAGHRRFMLLTSHTPGFDRVRLEEVISDALDEGRVTSKDLTLRRRTGQKRGLPSGVVGRWENNT